MPEQSLDDFKQPFRQYCEESLHDHGQPEERIFECNSPLVPQVWSVSSSIVQNNGDWEENQEKEYVPATQQAGEVSGVNTKNNPV
jgi:hypothetical protein